MDLMELRSSKTLADRGDKEYMDNDPEEEVQTLLEGYAVGGVEREGRISHGRLEVINPTHPQPPSSSTIDISSVRYRPTLVMTSAELTSTHGPSWPDLPGSGRVNIIILGFG